MIKTMKISNYNYKERIDTQTTRPKPSNFLKNYSRSCLNREHVQTLLSKEVELEFFHKMHVGDEFYLSVLYPLKNYRDFAVIYDDWEHTEQKGRNIKNKIKLLWEEEEKTHINKSKNRKIRGHPKVITDVAEDLDKIKNCPSYFYRKFEKDSNIEKYWKQIIYSYSI